MKFFLWPVALWLVATGRRGAAIISMAIAVASLLLLLPWIGILDYVRLLRKLGDTFDGLSYTPYALLVDLGAPSSCRPSRHASPRRGRHRTRVAAAQPRPRHGGRALPLPHRLATLLCLPRRSARDLPPALRRGVAPAPRSVGRPGTLNGKTWQTARFSGSPRPRWRCASGRTGLEALGRRDRGRARSGPCRPLVTREGSGVRLKSDNGTESRRAAQARRLRFVERVLQAEREHAVTMSL